MRKNFQAAGGRSMEVDEKEQDEDFYSFDDMKIPALFIAVFAAMLFIIVGGCIFSLIAG